MGGAGLAGGGVLVDRTSGVPAPPVLGAASYLLADLDTGEILVAKAPHAAHLPASTLKVLTALTVMPRLDPRSVVTADRADLVDGSKVGLVPGLTYTVHQLLLGMMLSSGNDAATALARVAGGTDGVAGTVAAMQQTADHLGARDTVVRDPSGLDAPDQVSSAYDLALFAREALRNPDFAALVATKRTRFPGKPVRPSPSATLGSGSTPTNGPTPRRKSFQIQNHNTLLYNYDGAIGVKNGYTVAAKWTIVGAAERDGHRYVVTALRRSDRSWRPVAALLDWGFAHGRQVRPVGRLVSPGELDRAAVPAAGATTPAATALAVGASSPSTGQRPGEWLGLSVAGLAAVALAGASALLITIGLRQRRATVAARVRARSVAARTGTAVARSGVSDPGRRSRPPADRDRPS